MTQIRMSEHERTRLFPASVAEQTPYFSAKQTDVQQFYIRAAHSSLGHSYFFLLLVKQWMRCFIPLFFPFLLSIIPLTGLFFENKQRSSFQCEQEKLRWRNNAENLIEETRLVSTFEAQCNQMVAEMKRRFQRITDPDLQLDGKLLQTAIHKVFPVSHFPPESQIFGFKSRSDGRLEPLTGEGFSVKGGKVLADFVGRCLDPEKILPAERVLLKNRCNGLFGASFDLEQFCFTRRGKATLAHFGGLPAIIIWDAIYTNFRRIGAFVCVLPIKVFREFEPLGFALKKGQKRYFEMMPILVSLGKEKGVKRVIFPTGTRVPKAVRVIARESMGQKDDISPSAQGKFLTHVPGWWILEDLYSIDMSYKILIVGRAYSPPKTTTEAVMALLILLLVCLWIPIFAHVAFTGEPLPMSMRFRVLSFFSFLATISLFSLYIFGSYYIDTACSRKINDEVKTFSDRVEDIETRITSLLLHHTQSCRQLLSDRSWCERILFEPPQKKEKTLQETSVFLKSLSPSIFLDSILVYGFNPRREVDLLSMSGSLFHTKRLGTDVFNAFVGETVENWQKGIASEPIVGSGSSKMGTSYGHLFAALLDPLVFKRFINMRQKADLMENAGNQIILFYDFFARQGKLLGAILLILNPVDGYREYLARTISLLSFQMADSQPVFGEKVNGCFHPLFPHQGGLWGFKSGRVLRSLMELAVETDSEQRFQQPSMALIARPCSSMRGFIIGGIVRFDRFQQEAGTQRAALLFFISALLVIFILLGVTTSNYLLVPLSQVKDALLRLGAGDLTVRVGLSRPDELGDLTQSFDQMIQGIQERHDLALFVSRSLDVNIGQGARAPEKKIGTILVADLRNFTTLSESFPPGEIVAMLNHHHHAMAEIIQGFGGIVELFIGDAIVAVFYEVEEGKAATTALDAAVAMMERHSRIQETRQQAGTFTYKIGIGIDRGPILAGSLGTSERSEYVVLGPPRTHAEQLEALSKKGTHTRIVASSEVICFCTRFRFVPLGESGAHELVGPA
ncbi:MAG: adenylate/guanylate cyclase domain-containing protein [Candidatus Ozemobacteraceae bacterium]